MATANSKLGASYRFSADRVRRDDPAAFAATLLFPPARRRQFQALEALRLCTGDIIGATPVGEAARGTAEMRACAAALRACVEGGEADVDAAPWVRAAADTFVAIGLDPEIYDRYVDAVAADLGTPIHETYEAHAAAIVPMAEAGADLIVPTLHLDPKVYRETAIEVLVASEIAYRMRDLERSHTLGRLHLPRLDIVEVGITPETAPTDPGWRDVVARVVVRTRQRFRDTEAGLDALDPFRRRLVGLAMSVSEAWLDRVEANGYDALVHRPKLGIRHQIFAAGRALVRSTH